MWLTYRKKYDFWWIMVMVLVLCCRSTLGWIFDNDNGGLSEGDKCRVQTGGPGICKRIETCEPYYEGLRKKTIAYNSLVRCALIGFNEVICCPTDGTTTTTGGTAGWGEEIDRPVAATTTTTTTTTTKRPIVIGDVTITGNEQFLDLSQLLKRKTQTTTTTTQRPRQNRADPVPLNNNVEQFNSGNQGPSFSGVGGGLNMGGLNVQWPNQQRQSNSLRRPNTGWFGQSNQIPQDRVQNQRNTAFSWSNGGRPNQERTRVPVRRPNSEWFNPTATNNQGSMFQRMVQFPTQRVVTNSHNKNPNPQGPIQRTDAEWFNPQAANIQGPISQQIPQLPSKPATLNFQNMNTHGSIQRPDAEWFNPAAANNQGPISQQVAQFPSQPATLNFQNMNTQGSIQRPDVEWFNPAAANSQGPISQQVAQFPSQPDSITSQNLNQNTNDVLSDLLAPFQFRPGSDDPFLVGTSTLRTIVHNELEDRNVWNWDSETTPRSTTTTTTKRSTTTAPTTTTTTPIPDWMEPILPNWMKEALGNTTTTTTTTTPRSQTSQPVLPAWMLEALNNASGSSNTFPAVTSIPVISTSVTTQPTTTTTVQTVITRNTNERPSQAACRVYSGYNPASLTFHILDGVPVAPGDYPHMGGLIYPDGGGNDIDVRCGSSLISERFTLTAAHCVIDPLAQPTMVRFGVVILQPTPDDDMEPVDVEIENISIHPDYRANLKYHDVAVIKLKTNVAFTPYIRPACLYSDMGDIDSSKQLVVIGWGVTNVETRSRSGILLMANLTSVPLDECNATHVEAGVQRSYRNGLNQGQYCAFDVGLKKDACQADSGGPLQLVQNKESTIVGIVSFGLSCGSAVPSVYARVAFYLSWIESIVWPSPS